MMRLALHWKILYGMIVGAAVGLTLNLAAGRRTTDLDPDDKVLPAKIKRLHIIDTPDRIEITIEPVQGEAQKFVVDGSRTEKGALTTLDRLEEVDADAYQLFQRHGRSLGRRVGDASQALGGLFLRLLKMVALPLIVSSLSAGVMGLGGASRLGRMFGSTLLYYVCTSMLAIVTGLLMVNLIRPGLPRGGQPAPAAASRRPLRPRSRRPRAWGRCCMSRC